MANISQAVFRSFIFSDDIILILLRGPKDLTALLDLQVSQELMALM